MTVHTSDSRETPTIETAKHILADLRRLTCQKEVILARYEKRIAALTAKVAEETTGIDKDLAYAASQLDKAINANPDSFVKPRAIKTPDGKFGYRDASKLEIDNDKAEILLEFILNNGYGDCLKVTRSFAKKNIRQRITENGQTFPGCRVSSGEITFFKIEKALIEEARNEA